MKKVRHSFLLRGISVLVILFCSLTILLNSMSKPVARDEQMYCTAGILLHQGLQIYQDFSYVSQLPYHPLLLAVLYRVTGTTYYLLTARLVSVLCEIGILLCVWNIMRLIIHTPVYGTLFALAGCLLYVFNPLVYMASGYAWNHSIVILCVLMACRLFITLKSKTRTSLLRILVIGGLLTCACCMRITTVIIWLWLFICLLYQAHHMGIKVKQVIGMYFLGTLLLLVWPLSVIAQAPSVFLLNLIKIPSLYGQWLIEHGITFRKLDLSIACLIQPGYLALFLVIIITWMIAKRSSLHKHEEHPSCMLLYGLPVAFFIIAYIPPTLWRQYLAVPVPFLVLWLAYPLHSICLTGPNIKYKSIRIVTLMMVLSISLTIGFHIYRIIDEPPTCRPSQWAPMQHHHMAQEIKDTLNNDSVILSLHPLLVLEAGCQIYPEFSCGSIVYRVADQLTPQERVLTHTVGPESIPSLIQQRPAQAIITGTEGPLLDFIEEPLKKLIDPDWTCIPLDNHLKLFIAQ